MDAPGIADSERPLTRKPLVAHPIEEGSAGGEAGQREEAQRQSPAPITPSIGVRIPASQPLDEQITAI